MNRYLGASVLPDTGDLVTRGVVSQWLEFDDNEDVPMLDYIRKVVTTKPFRFETAHVNAAKLPLC